MEKGVSEYVGKRIVIACDTSDGGRNRMKTTTICLPFGGMASSDPQKVRRGLVHPFHLLTGMFVLVVVGFVLLRLALF